MKHGSASIRGIVKTYLGAIARQPRNRGPLCREAAVKFIGLSQDPMNEHIAGRLRDVAMRFADAEHRAGQQYQPTVDDFYEVVEETAEAYADQGADDMAVFAERQQIHEQKVGDQRVSIAPESFHADATLGRAATIKYNPTSDDKKNGILQSTTLAFWQGRKNEAAAVTVDVGLISPMIPPEDTEFPLGARPYAIVMYGSDGTATTVKFDIGRGVRFTVVGNYVSILVGVDSSEGFQAQMTVGASIGMFAAPSSAPVFLTAYVDDLANNESSDFILVPSHAVQLFPVQTDATTGDIQLDFFAFGGGGSPIYTMTIPAASISVTPIPLTGDIGQIKLTNLTDDGTTFRLPFQLSM